MKTTRVLAIDLGASGGKCFAGLFTGDQFKLQEIYRFAHECIPFYAADAGGRVTERLYWDDILIYAQILAGLHTYRREMAPSLDAIGIDTWGADGQFVNPQGEAVGKIYAYRDHRLDPMIDEVKARIPAAEIYGITGIHFQPFNLSNQLLWAVRNRPQWFAPGNCLLPVPTLFGYYLAGVKAVDSTWASVSQLMDAQSKTWSAPIFRKLGIPLAVMPQIVPPGTGLGQLLAPLAERTGLNRARLVAVGSHDTASAFAAAPVNNVNEALIISSGTWSLVGKLVPQPITTADARQVNLSNEGGIGNIRLLKNCMGGWLVHELRRGWRETDGKEMDWPEIYRLAEAAPAFTAFIDPDDPGFYNPANMETAIRDYLRKTGQTDKLDRGAILRLVYESLALKYRQINEDISRISRQPTRVAHIVGGGSRNTLLNQFTANALDLKVLAGPVEATAVGNVMVQAVALGLMPSLAEARPLIQSAFPITEYRPQEVNAWDQAYRKFTPFRRQPD